MTSTATAPDTTALADALDSLHAPRTHGLCVTCNPAPQIGQTLTALCGAQKVFTGIRERTVGFCFTCAAIEAEYGGVEGGCPRCG